MTAEAASTRACWRWGCGGPCPRAPTSARRSSRRRPARCCGGQPLERRQPGRHPATSIARRDRPPLVAPAALAGRGPLELDRCGDLGGSDRWEDAEPTQRKYPEELRERAVRMMFEVRGQDGRPGLALGSRYHCRDHPDPARPSGPIDYRSFTGRRRRMGLPDAVRARRLRARRRESLSSSRAARDPRRRSLRTRRRRIRPRGCCRGWMPWLRVLLAGARDANRWPAQTSAGARSCRRLQRYGWAS